MRQFRITIITVSVLLIVGSFWVADFQNLTSGHNLFALLILIVSLLNILSTLISIRQENKNKRAKT